MCKRLDSNTPEQFTILLHIQMAATFLPNIFSIQKDGTTFAGESMDGTVGKTEYFTLPHLFQVDSTRVQVDFLESTWTPGTFYFGGSPAKFMPIIHMKFT